MGRLIVIAGIILVALIIFAIVYATMTRSRRATARRRPVAPDDDPEFLRNLRLNNPPADSPPAPSAEATDENEDDRG